MDATRNQLDQTQAARDLHAYGTLAYADATDTIALDFIAERRRGVPAKLAAQLTASFHGISEIRVLGCYEEWEAARFEVLYDRALGEF